ncbi:hypothetical protein LTR62_008301 [Meristemomyces frigidus]|uniref:Uncharacterized protein n=1 Tax=Meristemomyces frigidus TaxID=1508187 RepID=A0AAN7TAW2_9PEZI|nr:hypothetical protein LTR62_008301 [Meristemomyces frigidus]
MVCSSYYGDQLLQCGLDCVNTHFISDIRYVFSHNDKRGPDYHHITKRQLDGSIAIGFGRLEYWCESWNWYGPTHHFPCKQADTPSLPFKGIALVSLFLLATLLFLLFRRRKQSRSIKLDGGGHDLPPYQGTKQETTQMGYKRVGGQSRAPETSELDSGTPYVELDAQATYELPAAEYGGEQRKGRV